MLMTKPVPIHPARLINYDVLIHGLMEEVSKKNISMQSYGVLNQFTYTQQCTFDRAWNDFTLVARGLILDVEAKKVVATPFPKFFNWGERVADVIPDLPAEVTEKVDGSLIICFYSHYQWHCATKGSFKSTQAQAAQLWLDHTTNPDLYFNKGWTYLFEWVSPENKIVIQYHQPQLVLLSIYEENGRELSYDECKEHISMADGGIRIARRYYFDNIFQAAEKAEFLSANEEGYVFNFNGYRLKIKGTEYKRIHALISNCTPLAIWNMLLAGDNIFEIRKELPEEFWVDFDAITEIFNDQYSALVNHIENMYQDTLCLSDKELGLSLKFYDKMTSKFLFPRRKLGEEWPTKGKTRRAVFQTFRPNGNVIEGYIPSYAMHRVTTEGDN